MAAYDHDDISTSDDEHDCDDHARGAQRGAGAGGAARGAATSADAGHGPEAPHGSAVSGTESSNTRPDQQQQQSLPRSSENLTAQPRNDGTSDGGNDFGHRICPEAVRFRSLISGGAAEGTSKDAGEAPKDAGREVRDADLDDKVDAEVKGEQVTEDEGSRKTEEDGGVNDRAMLGRRDGNDGADGGEEGVEAGGSAGGGMRRPSSIMSYAAHGVLSLTRALQTMSLGSPLPRWSSVERVPEEAGAVEAEAGAAVVPDAVSSGGGGEDGTDVRAGGDLGEEEKAQGRSVDVEGAGGEEGGEKKERPGVDAVDDGEDKKNDSTEEEEEEDDDDDYDDDDDDDDDDDEDESCDCEECMKWKEREYGYSDSDSAMATDESDYYDDEYDSEYEDDDDDDDDEDDYDDEDDDEDEEFVEEEQESLAIPALRLARQRITEIRVKTD